MSCNLRLAGATLVPQAGYLLRPPLEAAESIEQRPVRGGVHQRALGMLAVDFDERSAQRFEDLGAYRLVVDEVTRASITELHAAQDHFIVGRDPVRCRERARRMGFG